MKLILSFLVYYISFALYAERPNIVLVMTDDQGWGQAGYMNHPVLKTPHFNEMASKGLRLDRFYAGAPVCSPTRASVLTGRNNDRTGVFQHGSPLRLEEKTLAQALKKAGYATGHFGKWHLDGLRGPGVPILKDDPHSPGAFGFDEWLTVTNFFDYNPIMGRKGVFEEHKGDSSEIIVAEALKFIKNKKEANQPFFTVVWYGSPHNPFVASKEDMEGFEHIHENGQKHHGEIVAMDRSLGTLRKGLKDLGVAKDTLIWFNSDNGGLKIKEIGLDSVGGLKGNKGSMWEGGLRVPCVIEWPNGIKPKVSNYPASTMDIMPTILDILGLDKKNMNAKVVDGESIKELFKENLSSRKKAIPFHYNNNTAALIDNNMKILKPKLTKNEYLVFNLDSDPTESTNIYDVNSDVCKELQKNLDALIASVARSIAGEDYPNGIEHEVPVRQFWYESPAYKKHLKTFHGRPEYKRYDKKIEEILKNTTGK